MVTRGKYDRHLLCAAVLMMFARPAACAGAEMQGPAPEERERSFYGINEDPVWNFRAFDSKEGQLPQFVDMLKRTGCGALRMPLRWRVVEPRKGEWDFSAVDRVVQSVPEDIQILGVLMSVPEWANGMTAETAEGWFDSYPPKHVGDWENAVSRIVGRYKHRIQHWEIWNEENGVDFYRPHPDPKAYTELLSAAYRAAKRADPECVVVLGGLQMNGIIPNPWSEVKIVNYLEDLYQAGARPYFDVCNIHPYVLPDEGAGSMMQLTRDTLSLMARYGDGSKPLWITEVGCGAKTGEAEEAQARLLADTFEAARHEPRIEKVFWFMLRDMGHDVLGPETSMGLFTRLGRPKPSLDAFRRSVPADDGEQRDAPARTAEPRRRD